MTVLMRLAVCKSLPAGKGILAVIVEKRVAFARSLAASILFDLAKLWLFLATLSIGSYATSTAAVERRVPDGDRSPRSAKMTFEDGILHKKCPRIVIATEAKYSIDGGWYKGGPAGDTSARIQIVMSRGGSWWSVEESEK